MEKLEIKLIQGDNAPRYDPVTTKQLTVEKAVITEQGMESGLPIVDFQMIDENGNKYFFMITGKLINGLSAAIRGANVRNHGSEEPF